jgi:hypothetical protein
LLECADWAGNAWRDPAEITEGMGPPSNFHSGGSRRAGDRLGLRAGSSWRSADNDRAPDYDVAPYAGQMEETPNESYDRREHAKTLTKTLAGRLHQDTMRSAGKGRRGSQASPNPCRSYAGLSLHGVNVYMIEVGEVLRVAMCRSPQLSSLGTARRYIGSCVGVRRVHSGRAHLY